MTPQQLHSHIMKQEKLSPKWVIKRAKKLAKEWRSDIHVYIDNDGILFSQGADELHPRRTPKFIEEYKDGKPKRRSTF